MSYWSKQKGAAIEHERTRLKGEPLEQIKSCLERFAEMNAFVMSRGGWITSTPGAPEIRMECLPSSELPDELAEAGYSPEEIEVSERITANEGIIAVKRYGFAL